MSREAKTALALASGRAAGVHIDGRYRIEQELGRGGMGAVYRVHDGGTDRVVALKLTASDDPKHVEMFEREYRTLSRLSHPRLIRVHDYGVPRDGGARYYTMELLGGQDMVASAPMPWVRACEHLRDVCASLALLHAQGLVHRDVNPRNVRLDETGRAKLLDFGALTSFGPAREVVGAPSCLAPEVLRGGSLDARTDLYSLGVVAFWSLTKTLPYAIDRIADAELAWTLPVVAPSTLEPSVPPSLDALVLSLLSLDPLGRPPSAADVIERLSAITELFDESIPSIVESHLGSAPFVGRRAEQAALEPLIAQLAGGRGAVLEVTGPDGMGKTRMLAELRIESQLAGLSCLCLRGSELAERGLLLLAVLRGLLEVAPRELAESATMRGAGIAPLLTMLRRSATDVQELIDGYEHGALVSALAGLVLEVSRARPLLLAVDDAHLLDAADATLLSLLVDGTPRHPLFVAVARPAGVGPRAVKQLAREALGLPLAVLEESAVEQLVQAIVGDAQHRSRLSLWLWATSRGHPGRLHAQLHELVSSQVVRYAGAAWILPSNPFEVVVQQDAREHTSGRLDALSPLSLSLARIMALHRGPLEASVFALMLPRETSAAIDRALERLHGEQLLEPRETGFSLRHERVRAELREALPIDTRERLHRELAHALCAHRPGPIASLVEAKSDELTLDDVLFGLRVGQHLLEGGDDELGTTLVRNGAIDLTIRGEGLTAASPTLELAHARMRERGFGPAAYGGPIVALTLAGMYEDWRLSYRYGDEALSVLAEESGLDLARRLTPVIGKRLALYIALSIRFVLFTVVPRRHVANHFRELMLGLIGIGSAILSVCCVVQDRARARKVGQVIAPLRSFPAWHPVRMVHEFQRGLLAHAEGDYASAHARSLPVLAYVRTAAAKKVLPGRALVQLEGGILMMLGHIQALRTDGLAEATMRATEALGGPNAAQAVASARAVFHGHRGERAQLTRVLEGIDQLAVNAGSIWRNDMSMLRTLWSSYLLSEDVMALKRAVQQLHSLALELPSVAILRDIVDACYLCERGAPDEALSRYERLFTQEVEPHGTRALQKLGAYARILRKAGRAREAREVAERALAHATADDRAFTVVTIALHAELALSLSALGEQDAAVAESERLLREHEHHDNPLLRGIAHRVRAELSLVSGEGAVFDVQLEHMRRWFYGTQNPALVAQVQRLTDRARRVGPRAEAPLRADPSSEPPDFDTEIAGGEG